MHKESSDRHIKFRFSTNYPICSKKHTTIKHTMEWQTFNNPFLFARTGQRVDIIWSDRKITKSVYVVTTASTCVSLYLTSHLKATSLCITHFLRVE